MKINFKKSLLLAFVSAGLVAGAAGVNSVSSVNASAAGVSPDLVMKTGASLYLDDISGLKFSYTVNNYNAENNYGMLIVPFDYLDDAGITDLTLAENDYVPALMQAKADGAIEYDPIVIENLTPNAENVIEYSIGNIQETNYVRQFFGIGFIKSGDTYTYATQDDNVRSVFEVANRALNKLNYGEWKEEEMAEKALLQEKEVDVLNPFITKGFEFVYGAGTTLDISLATYVNGNVNPTITTAKEKDVAFDVQWNYNSANLTRGENQTVTASVGTAFNATTDSVVVLKDATEYEIYVTRSEANLFGVADTYFASQKVADGTAYSTARLNGGYWNRNGGSTKYNVDNSGYIAIKNPNSEDGKYTVSTEGTYIDFYFTGNNMPIVEFYATDIEGNDFSGSGSTGYVSNITGQNTGVSGYVVCNGIARSDNYTRWNDLQSKGGIAYSGYTSNLNDNFRYSNLQYTTNYFASGISRYADFNPYLYRDSREGSDTVKGWRQYWQTGLNRNYYDKKAAAVHANVSPLSMWSVLCEGDNQNWHYVVGMYVESKKVYVEQKLYKVAEDGTETLHSISTDVEGATKLTQSAHWNIALEDNTIRSGYIIVHGTMKGNLTTANSLNNEDYFYNKFAYTMPHAKTIA